jgi:integrase
MTKTKLSKPPYVHVFRDRHGKVRIYFNRPGHPKLPLPGPLNSTAFFEAYAKAVAGLDVPQVAKPSAVRNTFAWLIELYLRSPAFHDLAASSRVTYRRQLDKFREEHGSKPVESLKRRHVSHIIGRMQDRPEAANTLLKRLKVLLNFAVDLEIIAHNPLTGMKGFKREGDGYHTWSDDQIEAFENRHPIGTKARLALALMLYTGQRRSDAVRMGWQHVSDGTISVRQLKTGATLQIPIHDNLRAVLEQTPKNNMTFLLTEYGKPFSPAGFGNWMRDRCDEARLEDCSSHGLRKACARRLAEAGCSNQEIKAITGHETEAEVTRYTKAADQKIMATHAMGKLADISRGKKTANHPLKVSISKD